jgi:hypothetical protein
MFHTNSEETTYQFTFTQHPDIEAHEKRSRLLRQMNRLVTEILVDENSFPPCVSDLSEDCSIHEPHEDEKYDFNMANLAKSQFAAGAYIGDASAATARKTFDLMASVLSEVARRRLVVWYHDGPALQHEVQTSNPKFTDDSSSDRRSFMRE